MDGTHDFYTTKLKIKGLEAPCLLLESRHDKSLKQECLDLGYTVFEIRHPDDNWADPRTIEETVLVNFWGYIALKDERVIELLNKKLAKDNFFQVNSYSLNRFDDDIAVFHSCSKLPAELA